MNINFRSPQTRCVACMAIGLTSLLLLALPARAQFTPGELSTLRSAIGDRIQAAVILGGDFGMSGATFSGAHGDDINVSKFGGAGDIGDPQPLGTLPIAWQPRLQGSMGYLDSKEDFGSDAGTDLSGTESKLKTFAIQFGGGARFWFNDNFSIAPTLMGMYGHSDETFYPNGNPNAQNLHEYARTNGLVDWMADTWTIRPAVDFQYVYTWRRTIFTLNSDPTYFHTESFNTSNPGVSVNGDSETWMNKLDVDVPLNKILWGHELRTGGFISRTEFYGDLKNGINTDYLYEAHGRLVLDYLNELWKVQWIGIGYSYLWGQDFHGYSYGLDIAFRF